MSVRPKKALKAVAVFLVVAIAQVYVQISFAEPASAKLSAALLQAIIVGRIATTRNQAINVNGASAVTGASLLTGATIQTPADVGATIDLGPLGSVDLAPNTTIKLEFDDFGNLRVTLISGCVIVRSKKETKTEVATEQGVAAKKEKGAGGLLDVCFPPGASAPSVGQGAAAAAGAGATGAGSGAAGAAAAAGAGGGIGTAATVAIVGGIIGAVVAVTLVSRGDNPSPS